MKHEELEKLKSATVRACGTVALVAAKPDEEDGGKKGGCRAMRINAYNGGLINVGWGNPVGIELSGLSWRADNAVPILCLHETYDIDAICGQAKKVKCDGASLMIDADFMPVSETAKKVLDLAMAGYRFQASVGVSPTDVAFVDKGESETLNGATVEGPCYLVKAGVLNEVSIVPLGADNTTNTAIKAATQKKEDEMSELKKAGAAEVQASANVEAAQSAERERVATIVEACKGHDAIMAKAIREGWTADRAELECLRAEKAAAEKAKIEAARPAAPAIVDLKAAATRAADDKTITASACMGASVIDAQLEKQFKGVDLDAAHDMGISRLSDIFAAYGISYRPGVDADMSKAIKAAFSTSNIPAVLSNVAHKFALVGFGEVGEDWRLVSRAIPVNDFKAVKGVRLVMGGLLKSLTKGGELKHVDLSDENRELSAATKGSIVGITREDLINDDLGVLSLLPQKFGQMAGRTINTDVFAAVSTTATDYGANTTGALNLSNLTAAFALAMGIKDADGNPLGAKPDRVLCSQSNYFAAMNIYQSEQLIGSGSEKGRNNVMRGILEPLVSPFLGTTASTAYWLFNSSFPLVDVAFLNGRQTPVVETAEANFNQLGIEMRCYFDFGAAKGETGAAVYSTGA